MEIEKDQELWKIAKKRASFKKQLLSYVVINTFLWILWYITTKDAEERGGIPWPIWSTLGWGIGIVYSYFAAYQNVGSSSQVEKEYQKLMDEKK